MRQAPVKLSDQDLDEILGALQDQLDELKTPDERARAGQTIDLFVRLTAAADAMGAGVWVDAELPSWALEQLRRAAVTAQTVPQLQTRVKELVAQVNSLRQKASAKKRARRGIRTVGGKARTSGAASPAAASRPSAPTAPAHSAAPAAAAAAGSSSPSRPTVGAAGAQGDGGA